MQVAFFALPITDGCGGEIGAVSHLFKSPHQSQPDPGAVFGSSTGVRSGWAVEGHDRDSMCPHVR